MVIQNRHDIGVHTTCTSETLAYYVYYRSSVWWYKTSQELRMLSSVTINCQITKIVMNSGSQLPELQTVSQMSKVPGLSKNLKIFQKSDNLPKIGLSSKNLIMFLKSKNPPKTRKSSKNLKIFLRSENPM